jgi:hypothetical protein
MHKSIVYSNGRFEIDNKVFKNTTVKLIDERFYLEEDVKELFYKEGTGKNCIVYTDNTVKPLLDFDPFYNEFILLAPSFAYEEQELLIKEQQQILVPAPSSVSTADLFVQGITNNTQKELIDKLKISFPTIKFNNDLFFEILNRLKKQLLNESDWTQLPDVQETLSDKEKEIWIQYRKELRVLDDIKNPLKARIPIYPTKE